MSSARRGVSRPNDPLPVVHASIMESIVVGNKICEITRTACGHDDDGKEITVMADQVTCKTCKQWIEKRIN